MATWHSTRSLPWGVGAAGFLHAFLRAGDVVEIGCQSMLVGHQWGITAIHADGKQDPYYMPMGQVTMMYSNHHGNRFLELEANRIPTYAQPLKMGKILPKDKVAHADAVATASDRAIYLHVINRYFDKPAAISIDLSDFKDLNGKAVHHVSEGRLDNEPQGDEPVQIGAIRRVLLDFDNRTLKHIELPRRSVSCIEITCVPPSEDK